MIEVKNLTKSFNHNTILEDINFKVEDGESVVIIGGSGCGKSTLLRCLNLLITPEKGEILFNGKNILDKDTNIDEYRRHVGMVYQHFNLFEHLNIMENMILAPMKVLKMPQEQAMARAEELLEQVGMLNRKYRMPSELSGGQKQRVAIARTLMMQPDMILFDEPTSALDPTMVDEVETVIKNLIDNGMTSVIVTHEMRFAEKISNRTVFLAEKGIYEQGPSSQVFKSPKRDLTRQFIYRSRLFSKDITIDDVDYYELLSEIKSFVLPYGCTVNQFNAIKSFVDEIVMPLLKVGKKEIVNFVCNETGEGHQIFVSFPTINSDPLKMQEVDKIGIKLLKSCVNKLTSSQNGEGEWEVSATL